MAENPVAIDNVAARWRPLTEQETENAGVLLDAAWAILQVQAPTVAVDTLDSNTEALVTYVIVNAVLRALKNPDNVKSESIDDYSFTRDDSARTSDLYFTDADLALLKGETAPRAVSASMDSWA